MMSYPRLRRLFCAVTMLLTVTATRGAEAVAQNACKNGQMAWLLKAGYRNGNPCDSPNGVVTLQNVAEADLASNAFQFYDYHYSFKAAAVRHAGSFLVVLNNGKYTGFYEDAVGGQWTVKGSRVSIRWSEHTAFDFDLSSGLPTSIQLGDGDFACLMP
jgi:hypothetical protein